MLVTPLCHERKAIAVVVAAIIASSSKKTAGGAAASVVLSETRAKPSPHALLCSTLVSAVKI